MRVSVSRSLHLWPLPPRPPLLTAMVALVCVLGAQHPDNSLAIFGTQKTQTHTSGAAKGRCVTSSTTQPSDAEVSNLQKEARALVEAPGIQSRGSRGEILAQPWRQWAARPWQFPWLGGPMQRHILHQAHSGYSALSMVLQLPQPSGELPNYPLISLFSELSALANFCCLHT